MDDAAQRRERLARRLPTPGRHDQPDRDAVEIDALVAAQVFGVVERVLDQPR